MAPFRLRICTVNLAAMQVVRDDGTVAALSAREVRLVERLLAEPGGSLDRETLNREVLEQRPGVISRALDAMVRRIRSKIEADPSRPEHLVTLHGGGYRLHLPASVEAAPVVLAAVGVDPTARIGPPAGWMARMEAAIAASGGVLRSREGDEHLVSFVSPARAAVFCLGCVNDDVAAVRAAACRGVDEPRARQILAAARAGHVLLSEGLYREVRAATGVRDRAWRALGAVRLAADGPPERLVEAGGDGSTALVRAEGNLVAPPTSLVGREGDEASVVGLLGEARLVTLTGTGGVGKTRLALQIGQARQRDGGAAWFCDLSGCRSERDVIETVARSLGIPVGPSVDPGDRLAVQDRDLVVLDNAEQAIPAVRAVVERWVARGEGARLLVTSRERLGSAAERVFELGPLRDDDGSALFRERAAALGVAVGDTAALRQLVARVGGLPLAIELAAARAEVLAPEALLERLDERLGALGSDPSRGARHADLRVLVSWSWELCDPAERRLLVACTPFVSELTLDDVEAVTGGDALDALHALRRRSLLWTPRPGVFALYPAVRAFVLDTAAPGDLEGARDHHARRVAEWGDPEVDDRLDLTGGAELLARLVGGVPDLLAAMDHALPREPEVAVRAFLGASLAMQRAGPSDQIEALARRVLPLGLQASRVQRRRVTYGAPPEVLREVDEAIVREPDPRARVTRLRIAWLLGERERCLRDADQLVAEARSAADPTVLCHALGWAILARRRTAEPFGPLLHEQLDLCRRLGNARGEAIALQQLGWYDLERGEREAALAGARALIERDASPFPTWSRLEALNLLGEVHRERAEGPAMLRTLEVAGEEARRLADPGALLMVRINTGLYHATFGDTAEARRWYLAALDLGAGGERARVLIDSNLGELDLSEGRPDDALTRTGGTSEPEDRLLGVVLVLRGTALAVRGDLDAARCALDRAVEVAEAGPVRVQGLARLQRATVHAATGDRAAAERDIAAGMEVLQGIVGPGPERMEAALYRAEVASALGDRPAARAQLAIARTELDALGMAETSVTGRWWVRLSVRSASGRAG